MMPAVERMNYCLVVAEGLMPLVEVRLVVVELLQLLMN
jgi:hypothetical protein